MKIQFGRFAVLMLVGSLLATMVMAGCGPGEDENPQVSTDTGAPGSSTSGNGASGGAGGGATDGKAAK